MKTTLVKLKTLAAAIVMLFVFSGIAHATLSTTYWTPMTPDIQGFGVLHIGVDNYFTTFRKQANGAGSFPTDAGFTIGVLPFQKFQAEVSIDFLHPSDYPVTFSAKMGSPENALFKGSPALEIGLFNQGFTAHSVPYNYTSADTFFGVVGKTIPHIGRLSAGPYFGNSKTLVNGDGTKDNKGFMAAFDHGFHPVGGKGEEFNRFVIAADYCSGKNVMGGGGVGLYYYFTKDISLLTGPVWFNDQVANGKWKWTIQLDINMGLFHKH